MKTVFGAMIAAMLLAACGPQPTGPAPAPEPQQSVAQSCAANGGTWIAAANECEYVAQSWCAAQGGDFNDCASACRNDPPGGVCTLQCVPVCAL